MIEKMLSIIVAKAKNNIIGKNNSLLWNLPEDMKYFKEKTLGHTVIMGRKTFESIGKALQERKNIVFSQNPDFKVKDENVKIVHSMLEIKEYIDDEKENFVIGGAMIYNLLMPYVEKLYVTEIDKDFEGDAFFPKIDEKMWKETTRIKGNVDNKSDFNYDFVVYERIK